MCTVCDAPSSDFDEAFAAWARIAVKFVDHAESIPIVRLGRNGLTVAVGGHAKLAPIGLPRRASIIGDATELCELRLVARAVTRIDEHRAEVTLQPSRADDHALLWQALRAYHLETGAGSWDEAPSVSRQLSGAVSTEHQTPAARARREGLVKKEAQSAAAGAEAAGTAMDERDDAPHAPVWCDTVFTLASSEDAWFFAHWLEYHFAEVSARARMGDESAHLHEIVTRIADHDVQVRFVFQTAERLVRASTDACCRWIAAEASRQLRMSVEHWLAGVSPARHAAAGWSRRAMHAPRPVGYRS